MFELKMYVTKNVQTNLRHKPTMPSHAYEPCLIHRIYFMRASPQ
jgi:hypothetical protein